MSNSKYTITKLWDGDNGQSEIHLEFTNKISSVLSENKAPEGIVVRVDAPYFNDPSVPGEIIPGSTNQLWDYEVVEVFFLGDDDQYLEIELAPKGHYLLLQLYGYRNMIKECLPLEYYCTKIDQENQRWTGEAIIPFEYFPKNVRKFNAYAIHKSKPNRVYMSLFPVLKGKYESPDFHRLEYFQSIDLSYLLSH